MQNGGHGALEAHFVCTPKVPVSSYNRVGGMREERQWSFLSESSFLESSVSSHWKEANVLGTQP